MLYDISPTFSDCVLKHFNADYNLIGCRKQVLSSLQDALKLKLDEVSKKSVDRDTLFDIQQNATIVADAENYYRTMISSDEISWYVSIAYNKSVIILNTLLTCCLILFELGMYEISI